DGAAEAAPSVLPRRVWSALFGPVRAPPDDDAAAEQRDADDEHRDRDVAGERERRAPGVDLLAHRLTAAALAADDAAAAVVRVLVLRGAAAARDPGNREGAARADHEEADDEHREDRDACAH